MSGEQGSVAEMLDLDADAAQSDVARLSHRIERLEGEIVEARADREQAARRMGEMRAAANILREVGLRSSIVKGIPLIEMDYTPKRPEAAAAPAEAREEGPTDGGLGFVDDQPCADCGVWRRFHEQVVTNGHPWR